MRTKPLTQKEQTELVEMAIHLLQQFIESSSETTLSVDMTDDSGTTYKIEVNQKEAH